VIRTVTTIVLACMLTAGAVATSRSAGPPPAEWRAFQGSWSAVGRRHTLPTDRGRAAAIVQLSGAVVLTDAAGATF